jgi:disulfide bond formation protein DsbB
MLDRIPSNLIPWLVLAASVATLAGAYFFQYALNYQPCSLCLQERIPYFFAIGAALVAGILSREANLGIWPVVFMALCALAFAINTALSAYHVGVEYKWWPGPDTCTGTGAMPSSLEELRARTANPSHLPRCDTAAWSLFGISLAGFNFLISLALLMLSSLSPLRFWLEAHGEDL